MYTHPPHETVRINPTANRNFPNAVDEVRADLVVKRYQRKTNANRGPEVKAIKI